MKTLLLTLCTGLLALGSLSVAVSARAQSAGGAAKAGTVATARGALDRHEPGRRMVLIDPATRAATAYAYQGEVLYMTPGGVVLTAREVHKRLRAGFPVTIEYSPHGDSRVIRRVILEAEPVGD